MIGQDGPDLTDAFDDGYDQGVAEVLSEMDPGDRARVRLKFPVWDTAWRKWSARAERDKAIRAMSDRLAGVKYLGPGGEGGER